MTKPIVHYRVDDDYITFIEEGKSAIVFPVDHQGEFVSNQKYIFTSTVQHYDSVTGEFETLNTTYRPYSDKQTIEVLMTKGYVIIEIGYEYNDEVYSTPSYGYDEQGTPVKVILDRTTAINTCAKMNFDTVVELFANRDIEYYGYSTTEIFGSSALDFMENAVTDKDEYVSLEDTHTVCRFFDELTQAQKEEFTSKMTLKFFTVKEIEVE